MKYEATNWKKGDPITAESLNKIEAALEELAALSEKETEVVEPIVDEKIESSESTDPTKNTKAKKG